MLLLINIIAIILALPLQAASLNKTWMHIREYHQSSHAHEHSHEGDEDQGANSSKGEPSDSDGGLPHSHAKELCGALVQIGISRSDLILGSKSISTPVIAIFRQSQSKGRITDLLVFRPPIKV